MRYLLILLFGLILNSGFSQVRLYQIQRAAGQDSMILTDPNGIQTYVHIDSITYLMLDSIKSAIGFPDTSIYRFDGTLTGNRLINLDNNTLSLDSAFVVSGSNASLKATSYGDDTHTGDAARIIGAKSNGTFIDVSYSQLADSLSEKTVIDDQQLSINIDTLFLSSGGYVIIPDIDTSSGDVNIYENDGTLNASRAVTMNSHDLNFDDNTFVIDGSANMVGIGTAAPTANLHISEDATTVTAILSTNSSAANIDNKILWDWRLNTTVAARVAARLQMGYSDIVDASRDSQIKIQGWNNAGFGTFMALIAGDVGIGDATPDARLDVEGGSLRLSDYGLGTKTGSDAYLLAVESDGDVVETDGSGFLENIYNIDGTLTGSRAVTMGSYDLNFDANTFVIDASADNLGAGTATPTARVSIEGTGNAKRDYADGDSEAATLKIRSIGGGAENGGQILFGTTTHGDYAGIKGALRSGTGPAGDLIFQTRNTTGDILERMMVGYNGEVGIGTSTPDALVDIEGGSLRLSDYGGGAKTGTETYLLGVESDGDVVELLESSLSITESQISDLVHTTDTDDQNLTGGSGTTTTTLINIDGGGSDITITEGYGIEFSAESSAGFTIDKEAYTLSNVSIGGPTRDAIQFAMDAVADFYVSDDGSGDIVLNATGNEASFSLNDSNIQRRVSSICGAGSSIRIIDINGGVTCETDSVNDADADASNELQNLSVGAGTTDNSIIQIDGGGTDVTLEHPDGNLQITESGNTITFQATGAADGDGIYDGDGTMTGNRTVTGTGTFTLNTTGSMTLNTAGSGAEFTIGSGAGHPGTAGVGTLGLLYVGKGTTPPTCTATYEGGLFFDTSVGDHKFYGCDDSSWVPFGADGNGIYDGGGTLSGVVGIEQTNIAHDIVFYHTANGQSISLNLNTANSQLEIASSSEQIKMNQTGSISEFSSTTDIIHYSPEEIKFDVNYDTDSDIEFQISDTNGDVSGSVTIDDNGLFYFKQYTVLNTAGTGGSPPCDATYEGATAYDLTSDEVKTCSFKSAAWVWQPHF